MRTEPLSKQCGRSSRPQPSSPLSNRGFRRVLRRRSRTTGPTSRRAGVTLLEVVISVAVMSVLMGGIASAIVLATYALPSKESVSGATIAAYQAASELVDDLHCALSFTQRTATTVEFTVADRTGDAIVETIRYEWSGTPGDPLTRTYNGSSIEVATNVHDLLLSYSTVNGSGTTKVSVVHVTLRLTTDAAARIDTSVAVLNYPVASGS